ncbi:hypothetical protein ULMS_11030 [Patiriisocius marinistellae]|uniref:Glycine dehydrogenase n=1 Tax=Patiriisocius marinistellae TaxID=2494560 RepID=A0A5J4FZW4_9FLAO|nr:hypothetical protein ULMS_11030 [Patiriisocius marinistellae]
MSIFLKCEEANHKCDKNQYKEASFFEMIQLNIHLIYCRVCRKYSSRNNKLTKAFKNKNFKTMPLDQKIKLQERLRQEISK